MLTYIDPVFSLRFRRHTCASGRPSAGGLLDDSFDLEEALEVEDLPKAHRHLHAVHRRAQVGGRPREQGEARRGGAGRGEARRGG